MGALAVFATGEELARECLSTTDATGVNASDPPSFSAYGEDLDFMPLHDSAMRISQITVCSGRGGGPLKGFSFRLSDPSGDDSDAIDTPSMGSTVADATSECVDLPVTGSITRIVTSTSGDGGHVSGISFTRSDSPLPDTFGTISQPWKVWDFDDES